MGKKSIKEVQSGEDYDKNYVSNETATATEVAPEVKEGSEPVKEMGSKAVLENLKAGHDYDADFVRDGSNHGQNPRPKASSAAVVG